jgi:hypothetical protein
MTNALYNAQRNALRDAFARMTGADLAAFDEDRVTITTRPEPPLWPFVAMVVTFGTGTVASFEPRFLERAEANVIRDREHSVYAPLALARTWKRPGEDLHGIPPMMGWAPAERRPPPTHPDGYRLERVDSEWMKEWQPRNIFPNALGQPAQQHRTFRNKFAFVLFDKSGEPAAVAGAFDSAGPTEIGVDVAAAHRGRGLAPIVVTAAARAIIDENATPYYACSVTNIPSQHTALASGFRPVCSVATAVPAGMGLA